MKLYRGIRTPEGCEAHIATDSGIRDLPMRNDVRNHSPDGANWGYNGSGPAQLALAILCDALGDVDRAQELYQAFKRRVVACIVTDEWTLTHDKVMEIVACLESGCQAS
jgi:hypothetical protein